MEIERLLALSTAHLPEHVLNVPDTLAYPNEYGGFFWVDNDEGSHLPELEAVLAFARQHDITWLKFDRDAPEIEELPTWNW
jgi:hypothetical protein